MGSPRLVLLLLVLAAISRSPAVADQLSSRADGTLTVGVTVDPICTVAITAGQFDPDDAIDVNCRNLRDGQPAPMVSDSADDFSEDGADARTVVIHF